MLHDQHIALGVTGRIASYQAADLASKLTQAGARVHALMPAPAQSVARSTGPLGGRFGQVWVGRRRERITMAHASRHTLVTVEEIYDGDLLGDERMAAGALSALYVGGVALAPKGAWPLALSDHYPIDGGHMEEYTRQAASDEGFAAYLADHVLPARAASYQGAVVATPRARVRLFPRTKAPAGDSSRLV